jgi:acetylglutamate kinase
VTQLAPPSVPQRTRAKARVLVEALPYFEEHNGTTVVIKIGGLVLEDVRLAERFAEDVSLLRLVGVRPLVVHGGGPQISELSRKLGLEPTFVDGLRVTDAPTLEVARMVLSGKITEELVSILNARGVTAVGLSGADGRLLRARPRGQNLGFVGEVASVNVPLLEHLMDVCVPVVASIATDDAGQAYNVNADLAASAIAVATGASKLVMLTDVPGVMRGGDPISEMSVTECRAFLEEREAQGGMRPKLEAAVAAVEGGVPRAHIIDGRVPHAVILEMFTPEGAGTMVTAERSSAPVPGPEGGEDR